MSAADELWAPAAPRRRIYLMRHGSVTYFDENGRPLGSEQVPLNARGEAQALAAGTLFRQHEVRFDRVIASGLPRTMRTAEIVLEAAGVDRPIEVWPELQEIRGGKLAELRDEDLRAAFLGAIDGLPPEDARFMGGESVGELLDRVLPAVDRLRADPGWQCALLVLHGGVNRAILSYAITGRRMLLGALLQSPACINALDVGVAERDWIVRYVNVFAEDLLQRDERSSTMEQLFEQYIKWRRRG